MSITIRLERSDAMMDTVCTKTGLTYDKIPTEREIAFDDTDGSWVQLTYESLRTQDGAILLAVNSDGDWVDEDGGLWSDVVIAFNKPVDKRWLDGATEERLTSYIEAIQAAIETADHLDPSLYVRSFVIGVSGVDVERVTWASEREDGPWERQPVTDN